MARFESRTQRIKTHTSRHHHARHETYQQRKGVKYKVDFGEDLNSERQCWNKYQCISLDIFVHQSQFVAFKQYVILMASRLFVLSAYDRFRTVVIETILHHYLLSLQASSSQLITFSSITLNHIKFSRYITSSCIYVALTFIFNYKIHIL